MRAEVTESDARRLVFIRALVEIARDGKVALLSVDGVSIQLSPTALLEAEPVEKIAKPGKKDQRADQLHGVPMNEDILFGSTT